MKNKTVSLDTLLKAAILLERRRLFEKFRRELNGIIEFTGGLDMDVVKYIRTVKKKYKS